jgi:hypothetical protein
MHYSHLAVSDNKKRIDPEKTRRNRTVAPIGDRDLADPLRVILK